MKAIKIKKSNRGKFTKYCKGIGEKGVTTKCIAKGSKSPSSAIRRRAAFAKATRKWHK